MKPISSNKYLLFVLLLFLFSCTQKSKLPPNIIIIQADDLGYSDIAVHGNRYVESPAIDNLAISGIQFKNFYVNSVCAPTRASLLTGRHFLRTGVSHVHGGKDFIHLSETLLPEALKENGYRTGMWGKWHSGKTAGYFPWERGFDQAYMAQLYKHEDSRGRLNGELVEHQKWASEVITDYAIDFIRRNNPKVTGKPFFAYLSHLSVHAPLRAPEHLISKYESMNLSRNLATIYGMVEQMDSCIQVLVDEVESLDLAENTIIFFLSDNGPAVINNLLTDEDRKIRYINGYKGHKGNLWENGVKSPLFVYWNGIVKPSVSEQLLDITDLYPTLIQLAGGKYPEPQLTLDGIDFSALIKGEKTTLNKTVYNWVNPGWPPTDRPWTPEGIEDEYQPVNSENKNTLLTKNQLMSIRTPETKVMQNPGNYDNTPNPVFGIVAINMLNDQKENHNCYTGDQLPNQLDELHDWFNQITNSPHSFSSPVFQISKSNTEILGYGPVRISDGLTNTSYYLSGWESGNQTAGYQINVLDEGNYKFTLKFSGSFPEKLLFTIQVGGNTVQTVVDSGELVSNPVFLKKGEQELIVESKSALQDLSSIKLKLIKGQFQVVNQAAK